MIREKLSRIRIILYIFFALNITALSYSVYRLVYTGRAAVSDENIVQPEVKIMGAEEKKAAPVQVEISPVPEKAAVHEEKGSMILAIDSKPSGAKIFLNGYYKGKTPYYRDYGIAEKGEEYLLTIILTGFKKVREDIKIFADQVNTFEYKLEENSIAE
jgi:hypothetical protein